LLSILQAAGHHAFGVEVWPSDGPLGESLMGLRGKEFLGDVRALHRGPSRPRLVDASGAELGTVKQVRIDRPVFGVHPVAPSLLGESWLMLRVGRRAEWDVRDADEQLVRRIVGWKTKPKTLRVTDADGVEVMSIERAYAPWIGRVALRVVVNGEDVGGLAFSRSNKGSRFVAPDGNQVFQVRPSEKSGRQQPDFQVEPNDATRLDETFANAATVALVLHCYRNSVIQH